MEHENKNSSSDNRDTLYLMGGPGFDGARRGLDYVKSEGAQHGRRGIILDTA